MNEQILVVPSDKIDFFDKFKNGWAEFEDSDNVLIDLLQHGQFMDRKEAEENPNFKQIIPYCVVRDGYRGKYFIYQRNKKGGVKRLHNLYSLGLGGHCRDIDGDSTIEVFFNGLNRELQEELGFSKKSYHGVTLGFIYDDSNFVGQVHLGVATLITPFSDLVKIHPEDTMVNYGFKYLDELNSIKDNCETWSQIILDNNILK